MLKFVDAKVTFSEVPNEIALCIGITGCKIGCEGCHSSYLAEDIGEPLTIETLDKLINDNKGITVLSFMGGDSDPLTINNLAEWIKKEHPGIKVCWYSGRQELSDKIDLWNFDFIKLGPYIKEHGPLTSRDTNQKFHRVVHLTSGKSKMYDITYKFQRDDRNSGE